MVSGSKGVHGNELTEAPRRRLVGFDEARMTPQADEAASLELAGLLGALAQRPGP